MFSIAILFKDVNSLPNDKFLDWFKLTAFADDNINVAEKLKIVLGKGSLENMKIGENSGFQDFLLFPHCFQKTFFKVVEGSVSVGKSQPFPKR